MDVLSGAAGVAGAAASMGAVIGAGALLKQNYIAVGIAGNLTGFCAVAGGLVGYFLD